MLLCIIIHIVRKLFALNKVYDKVCVKMNDFWYANKDSKNNKENLMISFQFML